MTSDDADQEDSAELKAARAAFRRAFQAAEEARKIHNQADEALKAAETAAIAALSGNGKTAFDAADAAYTKAGDAEEDADGALEQAIAEDEREKDPQKKTVTSQKVLDAKAAHNAAVRVSERTFAARWKALLDNTTPAARKKIEEASRAEKEADKKLEAASKELDRAIQELNRVKGQAR